MKPENCQLCGAGAENLRTPRYGRTSWDWGWREDQEVFTWVNHANGDECIWQRCNSCKGAFHTSTYRDQFNKLSEPDAERAMQLFLSGNPPRRWVWFGWGALAATGILTGLHWLKYLP